MAREGMEVARYDDKVEPTPVQETKEPLKQVVAREVAREMARYADKVEPTPEQKTKRTIKAGDIWVVTRALHYGPE